MNNKENKKTLLDKMGNVQKGGKHDPSKRYSGTENDISIDSYNFNYSREFRKNISFNSNNDNIFADKENINNEDSSKNYKTEGFTLRNNLDDIRNRNFKSIEHSNNRKKRREGIKEIEKKLNGINSQNMQNDSLLNCSFENKINNEYKIIKNQSKDISPELNEYTDQAVNSNLRKTTVSYIKNSNDNNAKSNFEFNNNISLENKRMSFNMQSLNKNKTMNLSNNDENTNNFINLNFLSNTSKDYQSEINKISRNTEKNLNHTIANYNSNVSDLKSLIQQSVDNVNKTDRRFSEITNINSINNEIKSNRRISENSDLNCNNENLFSNFYQGKKLGHNRVHSHSVDMHIKITNNTDNENYLNNYIMQSLEKDVSILNSSNNSNIKINYNDYYNSNNNKNNNNDKNIRLKPKSNENYELRNNQKYYSTKQNLANINENTLNSFKKINNYNKNNNYNTLTDSFNLNNIKSEEINLNNYLSTNNSTLADFLDSTNGVIKNTNQNLARKNIFEDEKNKRENITTLSLTHKINQIIAERESNKDYKTPEHRKSSSINNKDIRENKEINNINNIQISGNSFNADLINNSTEKIYDENEIAKINTSEKSFNKNFDLKSNLNLLKNNNQNNCIQANHNINKNFSDTNLTSNNNSNNNNSNINNNNFKFFNDSKNFEIIYEKEEEGISKNPSSLYELAKQKYDENKNSFSNLSDKKENLYNKKITVDSTNKNNINKKSVFIHENYNKNNNNYNNNIKQNKIFPEEINRVNIKNRLNINTNHTNQSIKNESNSSMKNTSLSQGFIINQF